MAYYASINIDQISKTSNSIKFNIVGHYCANHYDYNKIPKECYCYYYSTSPSNPNSTYNDNNTNPDTWHSAVYYFTTGYDNVDYPSGTNNVTSINSITIYSLNANTTYYVWVAAIPAINIDDGNNNITNEWAQATSPYTINSNFSQYWTINDYTISNMFTITTDSSNSTTICGAPTQVKLNSWSGSSNQLTIEWNGASSGTNNSITGYDIGYSTTSGGSVTSLTSISTSNSSGSATITGLSDGTYYFAVCTKGSAGSSYYSDYTYSSAITWLTADISITSISTKTTSSATINVSSNNCYCEYYYYSTSSATPNGTENISGNNQIENSWGYGDDEFYLNNLTPNTTYYIWVAGYIDSFNGPTHAINKIKIGDDWYSNNYTLSSMRTFTTSSIPQPQVTRGSYITKVQMDSLKEYLNKGNTVVQNNTINATDGESYKSRIIYDDDFTYKMELTRGDKITAEWYNNDDRNDYEYMVIVEGN